MYTFIFDFFTYQFECNSKYDLCIRLLLYGYENELYVYGYHLPFTLVLILTWRCIVLHRFIGIPLLCATLT